MQHSDKIAYLKNWCDKNGAELALEGECGFGRPCVGVLINDCYPDYEWYDEDTYENLDNNGEVWTPDLAYHKHPCVAVLGRGEESESQLYDWILWFEENNFKLEVVNLEGPFDTLQLMLGRDKHNRMVKVND